MAREFLAWLAPTPSAHWLDVGCGTGALTAAVCTTCAPASITGCEPSEPFVRDAQRRVTDTRASFVHAGSENLPARDGGFDFIVSGLVLNFVPEPARAVAAMRERLAPGGVVGAYVWDYAGGMEFLRFFWDEAIAVDASAIERDEGRRFPLCHPDRMQSVFEQAGLHDVETSPLQIHTTFADFDDYWQPFLGGTGPAPSFVQALSAERRDDLRGRLQRRLTKRSGPISLRARAWAIRGSVTG